MPNNSASGGYLNPAGDLAPPLYGKEFARFMHDVFVGITGLPNGMVRPRWQPEPPNQPSRSDNWLAFGVVDWRPETFAYIGHDPRVLLDPLDPDSEAVGADFLQRNEEDEILCSFYGPSAMNYCAILSDGLQLPQNREALRAATATVVDTSSPLQVPELVKEQWLYRADMTVTIRRQIRRQYAVYNLLSALGTLNNDNWLTDLDVTGP